LARKRRFGVSISSAIADSLDAITGRLGLDRSSLVEIALKSLLEDYVHHLIPHNCVALITHICEKDPEELVSMIAKHQDIKVTQLHSHSEDKCLQILLVSGPSSSIAKLYSELAKIKGCKTKYTPLHDIATTQTTQENQETPNTTKSRPPQHSP